LTEIHLCNVCSCHNILRRNGRGQVVWAPGLENWVALGEVRWKFGLAQFMEESLALEDDDGAAELRAVFEELDTDGSGALDKGEVWQALNTMKGREMTEEEVDAAMAEMDEDGGGEIELEEFTKWYQTNQYASASGDVMAALAAAQPAARQPRAGDGRAHVKKEKTFDLASTGAVKLGSVRLHAGLLCREEPKELGESVEKEIEEEAAQLRAVFAELDADGSGSLDQAEVGLALAKIGRAISDTELDAAMKEMDEDGGGEVELDEFAQWWRTQEEAAHTSTKMLKRWCVVVAVNDEGKAVKPGNGQQRAAVFYESKTALRPLDVVLSDAQGHFTLKLPVLSAKLVMRFPHCLGLCVDGTEQLHVLATR
jgi:Ca2+-binding EF-hand superfamily protein